jgi:SEC-C motif-containing protein
MRSRYSAYALGLADYIIDTTHRKNSTFMSNKIVWKKDILQFCQETQFEGLTILEFVDGAREAKVSFSVKLKHNGKDSSFTEKSTFLKESGNWLYRSGSIS